MHSTTDRPAGGDTGRLFLAFGGPVCADRISNCPLDRVLTYKNLIYLLNLQVAKTEQNCQVKTDKLFFIGKCHVSSRIAIFRMKSKHGENSKFSMVLESK